jgi:hypothetical protein
MRDTQLVSLLITSLLVTDHFYKEGGERHGC